MPQDLPYLLPSDPAHPGTDTNDYYRNLDDCVSAARAQAERSQQPVTIYAAIRVAVPKTTVEVEDYRAPAFPAPTVAA